MTQEGDRRRSLSERAYAVLLRAYPLSFRREAGLGMAEMFRDLHRETRARRGAAGLVHLWARTLLDTAWNAPAERIAALVERKRLRKPADRALRPKGVGTMETLAQDLRYALRALRQHPGFAAVTVLTLALGLGANTAIFSVVKAVLLSPLPYPEPERLAFVWGRAPGGGEQALSWPDFVDLREANQSFAGLAVVRGQSVNLTGGEAPERLSGCFVTASLFSTVLRRSAQRGRTFSEEETEIATARPVAVISHGLWQRRFGADPAVLGRSLDLNGASFTVVGVMPPDFELTLLGGTWSTDVFIPIPYYPNRGGLTREDKSVWVVGRMSSTLDQAQADLSVIAKRLEKEHPATNAGLGITVLSLREAVVGEVRPTLLVLQGVVAFVLLIACANVANLLLARATDRRQEIALRAALGAGRARILRQLVTESVLLAALGGVLGVALGAWGVQGLMALAPSELPLLGPVGVDRGVLGFGLGLSMLTGVVLGLAPALQALRADLSIALKEGGRSGGGRRHLRELLVVSEVALSLVLLIGAGLLVQSLRRLQGVDPGFRADHLLTLQFRLPPTRYPEGEPVAAFFRQAIERIRAIPGVESAALVRAVPLSGNFGASPYFVEGRPEPSPGEETQAGTNIVTPDYFRTLRIPLLQGRDFTDYDNKESPAVAVVNDTLSRQTWPGEDALGKRIRLKGGKDWLTVVGVVADVKHRRLVDPPQPQIYTAHYQDPKIFACVVARTASDPMGLADSVRKAIWSVDKDQPVWSVIPMERLLERAIGPTRFLLSLLAAFAGLAVVLAGVGIYGVLSYAVAQRTREIGIRVALGARAAQVVRLVVRQGMRLTLAAVGFGLVAAAGLSRFMTSLLFGVAPGDPVTFIGAAALIALVALASSWLPALRAARVDPATALVHE
jgi:putative ABC transport system permease protein